MAYNRLIPAMRDLAGCVDPHVYAQLVEDLIKIHPIFCTLQIKNGLVTAKQVEDYQNVRSIVLSPNSGSSD
jgi:hypothetical protein